MDRLFLSLRYLSKTWWVLCNDNEATGVVITIKSVCYSENRITSRESTGKQMDQSCRICYFEILSPVDDKLRRSEEWSALLRLEWLIGELWAKNDSTLDGLRPTINRAKISHLFWKRWSWKSPRIRDLEQHRAERANVLISLLASPCNQLRNSFVIEANCIQMSSHINLFIGTYISLTNMFRN